MDTKEFEHLETLFGKGLDNWYVGLENTVDKGFQALLTHLDKRGYILIDVIGIFDYDYCDQLSYFILYKALPNLEYLEYKYKEQVDNHGTETL